MRAAIPFTSRGFLTCAIVLAAGGATAVAAPRRHRAATPPASAPDGAEATAAEAPDIPDPATVTAEPVGSRHEGDYGGVKPGVAAASDTARRAKAAPRKGALSWIGFEPKGGGADVFLQSVSSFEATQHVEGGVLVVNLNGVSQLGQNTWRPVDTRFFDTPISRIVAKRVGAARASKSSPGHGAGVEVRITFKRAADAREAAIHSATEADGMYYVYLAFPGG